MQFDSLRAFPYPVLRPDVDDYQDGDIQVTVDFSVLGEGQEVTATVSFHVSVPELRAEVGSGRARYVVVFACRDTYFRRVCSTGDAEFKASFPKGSLRGQVEVYPYILAVEPISDFRCGWINSEFGPGPFRYEVGSVLAIDRPQSVYIDRDVLRPLASVFVLAKSESIVGHDWRVEPTEEKVRILLSPELKEKVDRVRNNKAHRAVLMNSIYFGAVMQCITELKQQEDQRENTRWGRAIMQRCENDGINIEEHEEHITAQRLMKSPFRLVDAYVFTETEA